LLLLKRQKLKCRCHIKDVSGPLYGECGEWLGCGNCTIAQLLKRASQKSDADLGWHLHFIG